VLAKKFRYLLNEDPMATEKTAEGIRKFARGYRQAENFIASKVAAQA
jgi:transaldolase